MKFTQVSLALVTLLFTAAFAQASQKRTTEITCNFTEPFIVFKFDLQKRTITRISPEFPDPNDPTKFPEILIETDITVEQISHDPFVPSFVVKTKNGQVHTAFMLNAAGSDGMSDTIYPYDARHGSLWGGCESNVLKAHRPY